MAKKRKKMDADGIGRSGTDQGDIRKNTKKGMEGKMTAEKQTGKQVNEMINCENDNSESSGFGKETEQAIIQMVQEKMPQIRVKTMITKKNNGQEKAGFQLGEQDSRTGIIVYQEDIMDTCGENCTAKEAAEYLCHMAEENLPAAICYTDLCSWERARSRVYKKVVNYEKNSSRLPALVHRRYLDLAQVYYLRVPLPGKDWGTAEVSVKMLEGWGVTEEELERQADANMDTEEYQIQDMQEFLQETFPFGSFPAEVFRDDRMYLILNHTKQYGAGILTSPGRMKELVRRIGSDCYILPSSVHELLAYPCEQRMGVKELQEMVQEVNQTAVSPEEFLSGYVYLCHMDSGEVELCQEEQMNGYPYGKEPAGQILIPEGMTV